MLDITKAFSDGIRQMTDDGEDWGDDSLHVSDLGIWSTLPNDGRKCPRQLWYRLNGYRKEPLTDGKRLMFSQGHRLEELVLEALELGIDYRYNIFVHEEVFWRIDDELIRGNFDLVAEADDMVYVIDIKTRRGNAFRYSNAVKPAENMQVLGYAYGLAQDAPAYTEYKGKVFEVDREGQNFARSWDFDITEQDMRNVLAASQEMVAIKRMPKPPAGMDSWLERKENKGDDSLKLKIPWQCHYGCPYYNTICSYCPPKHLRDYKNKVVGHLRETNEGIIKELDPAYRNLEIRG